jgi:hypothetical protein
MVGALVVVEGWSCLKDGMCVEGGRKLRWEESRRWEKSETATSLGSGRRLSPREAFEVGEAFKAEGAALCVAGRLRLVGGCCHLEA